MPLLSLFMILIGTASAETVLNCKEEKAASVAWQMDKGLVGNTLTPDEPEVLTLVLAKSGATLKRSSGQVRLSKLDNSAFIEKNGSGYTTQWTLFQPGNGAPALLYQQKAFSVGFPLAITVAYRCQ